MWIRVFKGVMLALVLGLPVLAQAEDPAELVRDTADQVLAEVGRNKAELDRDPSGIYDMVQSMVVPHFDFARMSQAALGRHWRDASDEQRVRLTREFQELLVRTYAVALLSYSGQPIRYLPVRIPDDAQDVMIPTRVEAGGPPVPIDYRLYLADNGWKVYDVVIDGVSMVTNYRSTFATQVRRSGIDGLIEQLAERNKQLRG
ncbi:MAG: ABC transporter substrate-binding protein [Gammaproteobacteria bacterium]|jgi:phospholipid transport system substrate-binding protein